MKVVAYHNMLQSREHSWNSGNIYILHTNSLHNMVLHKSNWSVTEHDNDNVGQIKTVRMAIGILFTENTFCFRGHSV